MTTTTTTISIHQTLKSFLETLQLERYHQAFIDAGATDQDLGQIVQFTEQELAEFLAALNMLPFHSIRFKKAVRELKTSHQIQEPPTSVALVPMNDTVKCTIIEPPWKPPLTSSYSVLGFNLYPLHQRVYRNKCYHLRKKDKQSIDILRGSHQPCIYPISTG